LTLNGVIQGGGNTGMKTIKTLSLVLVLAALALAAAALPRMMSVAVQQTQARTTPSFLGKIVADLAYGDQLQVVEEKGGWVKVVMPATEEEGWVHASALTKKTVFLKAGDADVAQTASSSEIALAGKGFNEQVEARYRQEKQLDYTWVDRMEGFTVSWEEIRDFVDQGGLVPLQGGE
jgi:SH3-like domain-containing protein